MTVTLRAIEPNDLDMLYRLENEPDVWRVSWGEAPVSRQLLWEYIQNYTADIYRDRQLRWIVEADGKPVGTVDISDFDPRNSRAMLGIAVDKDWRNKGIAGEAVRQAIEYCRGVLHLHQLVVIVPKHNAISMTLFLRAGFTSIGRLCDWLRTPTGYEDCLLMRLPLSTSGN